jgi:hypothetical protein
VAVGASAAGDGAGAGSGVGESTVLLEGGAAIEQMQREALQTASQPAMPSLAAAAGEIGAVGGGALDAHSPNGHSPNGSMGLVLAAVAALLVAVAAGVAVAVAVAAAVARQRASLFAGSLTPFSTQSTCASSISSVAPPMSLSPSPVCSAASSPSLSLLPALTAENVVVHGEGLRAEAGDWALI